MKEPVRPSYAPRPSPAQVELINALGGPTKVAEIISRRIGLTEKPLAPQAVSMWRKRGIPFRYRIHLAREAGERGIALPEHFLVGECGQDGA